MKCLELFYLVMVFQAYQAAETDEEKASSAKNLGLSNWRIVPAQVTIDPRMSLVQYYYKEVIIGFSIFIVI